eukprot:19965-Eustigmatos_ZCMA.PRE.1
MCCVILRIGYANTCTANRCTHSVRTPRLSSNLLRAARSGSTECLSRATCCAQDDATMRRTTA